MFATFTKKQIFNGLIIALLFLVAWFLFTIMPVTYLDWKQTYRLAALNLQNPYKFSLDPTSTSDTVFSPPWIFVLLYPFAILPHPIGAGLLMLVSVILLGAYTKSPKKAVLAAIAAPLPGMVTLGQFDGILLLGLMIPAGFGIPILLAKPQDAFLTILPRLNRKSILFTGAVIVASVLIWGPWWNNIIGQTPYYHKNVSLFPYTIPLGLIIGYVGYKRKKDGLLALASLCMAPYFMMHSALLAVAALIKESEDWRVWAAVVIGSWAYWLIMLAYFVPEP